MPPNMKRIPARSWADTLGSQFVAHPPIAPYPVEITAPDHWLVAGIESFDTDDELYLCEHADRDAAAPVHRYGHARIGICSNAHTHAQTDAIRDFPGNTDAAQHTDPYHHRYADAHPHPEADAHRDAHAHQHALTDGHLHAIAYPFHHAESIPNRAELRRGG